jgi:lambda family phage portal protein
MAGEVTIFGADGRPVAIGGPKVPVRPSRRTSIRARYDAAQTVSENSRHWANADHLSAREANSPEVRRTLRSRARYECSENNSYAWGIVQTLANDTIGTGPRLQLKGQDIANNRAVEEAFGEWASAVGLAEKLRLMRQARAVDGESFALLTTNPNLSTAVQLDILVLEADQVATPSIDPLDPTAIDGIETDNAGYPRVYHVLDGHPGDATGWNWFDDYRRVPARFVLHWFRKVRAGQYRGIPDVTPALPLFAQLRRFTLAVLAAAETAADFAAVLYSELAPDGEDADDDPFESFDIEPRTMTTLPRGWKMGQFRAEQPATTYEMFKREILNEIARCLNMPYNVAAGNSSAYNYASGRLDWQTYFKSLEVDQHHLRMVALDRIFAAWLAEAKLTSRLIPGDYPPSLSDWPHDWIWPGIEHVDPQKEANAQAIRLANGMTSFDEECARQGVDPDTRAENIAKGLERWKRLGIDPPAYVTPSMPAKAGANTDED